MDIFRDQTEQEKEDFINIGEGSPIQVIQERFRFQLEAKAAEYIARKKPFCARCAKIDFQKGFDEAVEESKLMAGFADFGKIKVPTLNLDTYGKDERFELIKDQKANEPITAVAGGTLQRQMQIGVHRDYRCKVRKCGLSIFISNEELAAQNAAKDK